MASNRDLRVCRTTCLRPSRTLASAGGAIPASGDRRSASRVQIRTSNASRLRSHVSPRGKTRVRDGERRATRCAASRTPRAAIRLRRFRKNPIRSKWKAPQKARPAPIGADEKAGNGTHRQQHSIPAQWPLPPLRWSVRSHSHRSERSLDQSRCSLISARGNSRCELSEAA